MKGSTALILSDLNGFCLNVVRKFAKQGYTIVLNGYQTDENIITTIQNDYQQCKTMLVSDKIKNEIDIHKLVEQTLKKFKNIDIVIINNQCNRHYRASIDEFPTEKWREIIDHNVVLTFALVKTLWPYMKRQYFGRIINIANEHSVVDGEYKSACITSYYALCGLNKAISIEGASFGITSNIIYPGNVKTNLFEQYNNITTLSDLILFLCSDQARSISGQSIPWLLT